MGAANSPPCWARVMFLILKDGFFFFRFGIFYLEFFFKNSIISNENVKKQTI